MACRLSPHLYPILVPSLSSPAATTPSHPPPSLCPLATRRDARSSHASAHGAPKRTALRVWGTTDADSTCSRAVADPSPLHRPCDVADLLAWLAIGERGCFCRGAFGWAGESRLDGCHRIVLRCMGRRLSPRRGSLRCFHIHRWQKMPTLVGGDRRELSRGDAAD